MTIEGDPVRIETNDVEKTIELQRRTNITRMDDLRRKRRMDGRREIVQTGFSLLRGDEKILA